MESTMESLLGNASDIISIAGALEAMNDDDDRLVLALRRLPVAMGEQAGLRVDLEEPGFGGWDIEPPGDKSRDDSHCVAVLQEWVRFKGREGEIHTRDCISGALLKQGKGDHAHSQDMIFRMFCNIFFYILTE